MKRSLVAIAALGGLAIGSVGALTAQATAGDNACKVKTTMSEETVSGYGSSAPKAFRWVKTEKIRCGGKSITIVTRGDYQKTSPFN